jgi:Arc/MetJ family transcription regulator
VRTNIVLDDDLVREAFRVTDARTKRELIHLALRELVRIRRKRNLAELAGRVGLRDDFDHKALRDVRSESG